jgi:hypothetical protein
MHVLLSPITGLESFPHRRGRVKLRRCNPGSRRHAAGFDDCTLASDARDLMRITEVGYRLPLDDTIVF